MSSPPPSSSGSKGIDRFAIAQALREIGLLLGLQGGKQFQARAYENGARAIEGLTEDLDRLVEEKRLTDVKGIGAGLAAQIEELHGTGRSTLLERLREELPPGILELSQLPSLGPKKVEALHKALGVSSVPELKAACEAGRVRTVRGFGPATERAILDGIRQHEEREARILLLDALPLGAALLHHLRAHPAITRAELAGELRRRAETVGALEAVVATDDAAAAAAHFLAFPQVAREAERTDESVTARLASGVRALLHLATPATFGAALVRHTGPAEHVALLGEPALSSPAPEEADVYARSGAPWLPPELREDPAELAAARAAGRAPDDLLDEADVRGLVHCHTVYSDGRNTIEEMALAADALGMRYLTITDHSPSAYYARGVELDRLRAQWAEIDAVQERVKVRLLRGTESDILADGALDYPDAVLEQLDVVIASIHSRMKMDEDEMTRRLVRAMRQPVFKIWGHALGRLLLRREPFACRVEEVLDAAAASRVAVEVNGDPYRLDMEPRWLREARRRGLRFVVSTDAHSTAALRNVRFGVGVARRGGLRRGDVLNTLDVDAFRRAVRPAG